MDIKTISVFLYYCFLGTRVCLFLKLIYKGIGVGVAILIGNGGWGGTRQRKASKYVSM